ncbi:MAG: STAS domain-containing protein [Spirochaetota bacterium]
MSVKKLNIQKEKIDTVTFMRLQGAIDAFTHEKFNNEVKNALRKGGVILDLEEVSLISSIGIRALKEISDFSYSNRNKDNTRNKIILLNLSENVKKVLKMMELYNMFSIAVNEELAMKMVQNQ